MISTNSCGWLELRIGDIAEIVAGGTPAASNPENFKEAGTGIAWLTPADLSGYSEKYISFGARDLSQQGYDASSAKILPKGSLLFSSRAPIGYVAIAKNEISTNQGFKNFVFPDGVDSEYAYYYLKSIKDVAESMGSGTTFKEISGSTTKMLPFLLPPLAEQKVIVEKLDVLLAQVEIVKARLERIPDILQTFRQAILATAVSGRLTSAISAEAIAEDTVKFENILKDKKHLSYGVLKPGSFDPNGVPMLRVMDIGEWGKYNDTEVFKISKELSKEFKRTIVEPGDIVLSVMATIGRPAVIPPNLSGANVNRALAVIKLKSDIIPEYILLQLLSPNFQSAFVDKQIGSAQKRINLSDLRQFDIWLPTVNTQTEIVRRVKELFTFADSIEKKSNAALMRVNKLTQSILAKAFRGELTVDWRAANPELISGDNSAEALLENIKAELKAITRQLKPKRPTEKKKTGNCMTKQILNVTDALKQVGKPLSGQQLLMAAGYPLDSSTDQLEQFFLDIRNALVIEKSIVKLERDGNSQDWFALVKDSQ
ncbi:restriction endonuclease subunit S [Acinetobacter sp. GG2]|uniref:restriction endonuclease subunit S n=1 Tax=Acinetobacter sp. GG2 TaxID=651305 RepID=UPI0002E7DF0E|nr:restriction endonuclease subunit S [Acinetobacter sp. GG2]